MAMKKVAKKAKATLKLSELTTGSTRVRLFKALNRFPRGLSAKQIKEKTGMAQNSGHLAVIIGREKNRKALKVEQHDINGRDILLYLISEKGRNLLKTGNLDFNKASGSRIGHSWTKGKRDSYNSKKKVPTKKSAIKKKTK